MFTGTCRRRFFSLPYFGRIDLYVVFDASLLWAKISRKRYSACSTFFFWPNLMNKDLLRLGIALLIFGTNVSLVLQKNVWKNENLNCGFSRESMSLKFDQKILLPSIFSFYP